MFNSETSPQALQAPFHPLDLEWRLGSVWKKGESVGGKCFAYVTNRAIMERLDTVVGAENWQTDVQQLNPVKARDQGKDVIKEGFLTSIGIRIPGIGGAEDSWVWKTDGADNTDFEAIKGGISGATKRAAVSWGIGRYLYELPVGVIMVHSKGIYYEGNNAKTGKFNWSPPAIPAFALPNEEYTLTSMREYLKANYDEKKHKDVPAATLNGNFVPLAMAMKNARSETADYYLTFFCYEGLKRHLTSK